MEWCHRARTHHDRSDKLTGKKKKEEKKEKKKKKEQKKINV